MLRQFMGELWGQGGEPWKGLFSRMQQAMVRLYLPLDNWVIIRSQYKYLDRWRGVQLSTRMRTSSLSTGVKSNGGDITSVVRGGASWKRKDRVKRSVRGAR